ncbi:MAG: ribosome biogenesis GTPase Der [Candidatus Omnitrophota bacterium]
MENYNKIPTICIVGRPNVGKSSLFNCLTGARRAVVAGESGTTRDRAESLVRISGFNAKITDTGGYLTLEKDELYSQVKLQIYRAMEEASIILMVVDAMDGLSGLDEEVAFLLRKFNKPVILAANKIDNDELKNDAMEFYKLGFGEPVAVSCLHRKGLKQLQKCLAEGLKDISKKETMSKLKYLNIAVVGRPNVGKSSFVNTLLARERVIVSEIPGTTRDSIDTYFVYNENEYVLVDTAGIRHKKKVKTIVDVYSMIRSREAITRADVVFLLLDAVDGVTKDDIDILSFIEESGKAALLIVNKWDLAAGESVPMGDYEKRLFHASNRLGRFPILFVSSKTGRNVPKSLEIANVLNTDLDIKATTPFLNSIFEKNDPSRVPIPRSKKRPNFLYIVQSSRRPIEFKYFVNDPSSVLSSHISFIENQLRANLSLKGIPIKILIRRSRKKK